MKMASPFTSPVCLWPYGIVAVFMPNPGDIWDFHYPSSVGPVFRAVTGTIRYPALSQVVSE